MGLLSRIADRFTRKQVVTKYADAAWHAAGTGRRAHGWYAPNAHVNALLGGDVQTLRRRSRAEARVNPWALNAIGVFVDSVVGEGIAPTPITLSKAFREEIEAAWLDWVEECDADGVQDFYGLQAMVVQSYREGGDVFARFRDRQAEDGLSVPLQLQILESELVDASYNALLPGGRRIRAGIEFDPIGRRAAYHMWRQHPGDYMIAGQQRVAVPAENVLQVFTPTRPGQLRGVPSLSAVLTTLHDLQESNDAKILNQKIRNMLVAIETIPTGDGSVFGNVNTSGAEDDDGDVDVELEPGISVKLKPGHDVKFSDPPTGADDHEAFVRNNLRGVAVGSGVTYEGLTSDLAQVNYSSIRAGTIEQFRRVRAHSRRVLQFQFNRPVFARWLKTALISGRLKLPAEERDRVRILMRPKWVAMTGQKYVNPLQEIKAVALALDLGLTSRTREVPNYAGVSAVELDRERVADREREEELGLPRASQMDTGTENDRDSGAAANKGGGDAEADDEVEGDDEANAA